MSSSSDRPRKFYYAGAEYSSEAAFLSLVKTIRALSKARNFVLSARAKKILEDFPDDDAPGAVEI